VGTPRLYREAGSSRKVRERTGLWFRFVLQGNHASGECGRKRAGKLRGESVHDQFDVTLEDQDLLREVELTTNLIIAASETDEHLSLEEIDAILGVSRPGSA
jgi:hypothetical protein